jgi:hypothetical protein
MWTSIITAGLSTFRHEKRIVRPTDFTLSSDGEAGGEETHRRKRHCWLSGNHLLTADRPGTKTSADFGRIQNVTAVKFAVSKSARVGKLSLVNQEDVEHQKI